MVCSLATLRCKAYPNKPATETTGMSPGSMRLYVAKPIPINLQLKRNTAIRAGGANHVAKPIPINLQLKLSEPLSPKPSNPVAKPIPINLQLKLLWDSSKMYDNGCKAYPNKPATETANSPAPPGRPRSLQSLSQ
tara:strand:+ start:609 stop:1013 length:405 start_codon:yes stop_codon:yes gene_type:complete